MHNTDDRATSENLTQSSLIFLSDEPGDALVTEVYKEQLLGKDDTVVEVKTVVITDCKHGDEIIRNEWL